MIDAATVEEYMREANPIPAPENVDTDEFTHFVAVVQARRAAAMQAPTQHPSETATPPAAPVPRRRSVWVFAAAFVLTLVVVGAATLLLSDGGAPPADELTPTTTLETTQAPATTAPSVTPAAGVGTLDWATAAEPPSGQVLPEAVTAMDTGYLAAAHTADGVEFWRSDDGDTWTLLAADPEAFRPNYAVQHLDAGPAGFTAVPVDPFDQPDAFDNTVFASTDGATWYRTELTGNLPESPSPYFTQVHRWHDVWIGADGFLAFGSGSLELDFDRIATEYAPGYGADDWEGWAIGRQRLTIDFWGEDETPLVIPISELGLEADDVVEMLELGIWPYLWWSGDGENWEQLTPQGLPEFWHGLFMSANLVGADDGFYLFYVGGPDSPYGPGLMSGYHSKHGRVWTQFEFEAPGAAILHFVDYGGGLFVAMGEDESGPALWTSTDARVWERAPGSETLFDLGYEGEYGIEAIEIGGAGSVAVSLVPRPRRVIVKAGFAVTFGEGGVMFGPRTITDEATGEVEIFDVETERSATIQMVGDETGLTFVDIDSGETLFVLTYDEIDAAMNAAEDEAAAQAPAQVLRYSTDLATWTLDPAAEVFGEGSVAVSVDTDGDTVLAVAVPPTVIWIGTPAG